MKTHVIDGKTYVEVDRKAEVGEKVIATKYCPGYEFHVGDIFTVKSVWISGSGGIDVENDIEMNPDEYRVLEPVVTEEWPLLTEAQQTLELTANDIRWQPDKVIDLLANLARRVSSLEAQLADTQGNVERQAEEIAELKHLAESNSDDIRELDDRTQVINAIQKHYGGAR